MLTGTVKIGVVALCGAFLLSGGIALADSKAKSAKKPCNLCWLCAKPKKVVEAPPPPAPEPCKPACPESDMSCVPPNPQVDECYARALIPATFKTLTERHCVKEASERLEIVPAVTKEVEERVCVKEAVTQLEMVPAEYKWVEKQVQVKPAYKGWVIQKTADCTTPDKDNMACVFCMRTTPPEYKTVRTEVMVKPPCTRQVTTPAEYKTIKRLVVVTPATTRKVCIPAEYEDVQQTVMVCPEYIKWEKIVCEEKLSSETVNKVKTALLASGYKPGPLNGTLEKADWDALHAFQFDNRLGTLGIGQISYDTLKKLRVAIY